MSVKKIKEHNPQQFLDDLKSVNKIMVLVSTTGTFLSVLKREVLIEAERTHIFYHLDNNIFKVKRNVMVIE